MIADFLKTIVVPCAGRGERAGRGGPKSMTPLRGEPILGRVLDFWGSGEREKWIFIVSPGDSRIREFASARGIDHRIVVQKNPTGVADAILCVEDSVDGRFTVALGDCLFRGDLEEPECTMEAGVCVRLQSSAREISRNYGVVIDGARITAVHEKPANASGWTLGMGAYFFGKNIFDTIRRTPPDQNGETQITTTLETWLAEGKDLTPVVFRGDYINVNDERDLEEAKSKFGAGEAQRGGK